MKFKKIKIKNAINTLKTDKKIFILHILRNILFFALFLISYFLYYLSLEKCFEGPDGCSKKEQWIKKKLIEELISCLIIALLFQFMFYKIISKIHLIHLILVFIAFYKYSHGLDFDDHGYFNALGFIAVVFIILICCLPLNGVIFFNKKKSKKYLLYYILNLITFCHLIYQFSNLNFSNCNEWPYGLNNSYIENNRTKYGCQILFPDKCPYKIMKYFQDITKIKGVNCKNSKKDGIKGFLEESTSPYLNKNKTFKRVGYPLMNKDKSCFLDFTDDNNLLKKYFLDNLVDMDNEDILNTVYKNKIPEIEIDFRNNSLGTMIINVRHNKTLSEERKANEANSAPYSNNILVLYIDSVSRVNSIRQLKKTLSFFEKFMPYKGNFNKNNPSENFHSFQFFKYHSFKYFTQENFPLIFYGRKREQDITLMTKYLKKNGYVTSYIGDACKRDNIRMLHNLPEEQAYDHLFLICDPNSEHYNTNTIRCLYGKMINQHLFEYGNQFWRIYKDNRKFLSIITNDGHEGTLEVLKYSDDVIYNFLNKLFNDNLLSDTTVFLLSDHGVGMPSIYYFYNFYQIELRLPMLYIIVNDRKNITYNQQYANIHENQQTFITAYDIYNTIINLIYGDKYVLPQGIPKCRRGRSLFDEIDPKVRKPNNYYPMSNFVCK